MKKKIRNEKVRKRRARQQRVGRDLRDTQRARLTVYRSARHTYAQLVDGESGRTLGSVSTRSPGVRDDLGSTGSIAAAERVGAAVAKLAREKGLQQVVFNRNGFLYHGRIKALAEAARKGGLEF